LEKREKPDVEKLGARKVNAESAMLFLSSGVLPEK